MTAGRFAHSTVEQCAEIADVCVSARQPELISALMLDGTRPEDVRQLLAKPTICAAQFDAEQLNPQALEEAECFSFASLSGEVEFTR
jgi:hypothetical protein